MFSVKIVHHKEKRNFDFLNTVNTMINFIFKKLNIGDSKVISDDSCIEIISGKEQCYGDNEIVVELLIRKNIIINKDDFNDKRKLDEHLYKIKHFCEQAKEIENLKYLPINMR